MAFIRIRMAGTSPPLGGPTTPAREAVPFQERHYCIKICRGCAALFSPCYHLLGDDPSLVFKPPFASSRHQAVVSRKAPFGLAQGGAERILSWDSPQRTPARLLIVIAVLFAALLAFFVWNRVLNRIVERRGRALFRAEIANATSELRLDERTRLTVELRKQLLKM